jgi:hypothetical protein
MRELDLVSRALRAGLAAAARAAMASSDGRAMRVVLRRCERALGDARRLHGARIVGLVLVRSAARRTAAAWRRWERRHDRSRRAALARSNREAEARLSREQQQGRALEQQLERSDALLRASLRQGEDVAETVRGMKERLAEAGGRANDDQAASVSRAVRAEAQRWRLRTAQLQRDHENAVAKLRGEERQASATLRLERMARRRAVEEARTVEARLREFGDLRAREVGAAQDRAAALEATRREATERAAAAAADEEAARGEAELRAVIEAAKEREAALRSQIAARDRELELMRTERAAREAAAEVRPRPVRAETAELGDPSIHPTHAALLERQARLRQRIEDLYDQTPARALARLTHLTAAEKREHLMRHHARATTSFQPRRAWRRGAAAGPRPTTDRPTTDASAGSSVGESEPAAVGRATAVRHPARGPAEGQGSRRVPGPPRAAATTRAGELSPRGSDSDAPPRGGPDIKERAPGVFEAATEKGFVIAKNPVTARAEAEAIKALAAEAEREGRKGARAKAVARKLARARTREGKSDLTHAQDTVSAP